MRFDITTVAPVHTVISIVAIAAGLVVVGGLIAWVRIDGRRFRPRAVVTAEQASAWGAA
jgi:hypothetical protein